MISQGRAQTRGMCNHFGKNSLLKCKIDLDEVLTIYGLKGEQGVSKNVRENMA